MALSLLGRALHFVFKISDRKSTADFYLEILGMKALRHEEFSEGCEAACNGPYANRWSKTMMGYGPEDNHFVIELTYNYGVKSYQLGNDFLGITIRSSNVLQRARKLNAPIEESNGKYVLTAPGGYKFYIIDEPETDKDPVEKLSLASSNLKRTIEYWNGLLGLKIIKSEGNSAAFAFNENECLLEFVDIGTAIDHATSYGRVAFSVPRKSLEQIQKAVEAKKEKILTPLVTLDTPGKESVTVVILADPDGHEICFVDDEGFRKLSQVDPKAGDSLQLFIKRDKS